MDNNIFPMTFDSCKKYGKEEQVDTQISFQEKTSIKHEAFIAPSISCSNSALNHSMACSPCNPTPHLLVLESTQENPSCSSSQSSPEKKIDLSEHLSSFSEKIQIKNEHQEIAVSHRTNRETADDLCVKKEEIKDEYDASQCHSEKSSIEEYSHVFLANFYQKKIHQLTQNILLEKNEYTISQGEYDYMRVRVNRKTSLIDKKMGIEVFNKHLECFDKSLIVPNSFHCPSKNQKRKVFQLMMRREINSQIKEEAFSRFVRLSLGEKLNGSTSYLSWKKSIAKMIDKLAHDVIKKVLKGNEKDLGKVKGGFNFVKIYLNSCENFLVREIMRYALFSIFIKIDGDLKQIFVSRASMGLLLNKYSDCFLEKFVSFKDKGIFVKGEKCPSIIKGKSKNKFVKQLINEGEVAFKELFKSDYKTIQNNVLTLDRKNGFRTLMNDEMLGLIDFIHSLCHFDGRSGIIERCLLHFYKENYNSKRLSEEDVGKETKEIGNEYAQENISKKIKKEGSGHTAEIRRKNNSEIAKNYCQLMFNLIKKEERRNTPSISGSSYDFRCFHWPRHRNSPSTELCEKIEITNDCILSFDPLFGRGFSNYPFSKDPDKRNFQKELKDRIDKELKHSIFLNFVNMSLPGKSRKDNKTYLSWKKDVSKELSDFSKIIATEVFHENRKKRTNQFIKSYLSFRIKCLIKEMLRYALFSIPLKKENGFENFFVSRAGLSKFLNTYSDHFLSALCEHEKINKSFKIGPKSSHNCWKKSKIEEISTVIHSSQKFLGNVIQKDHDNIRQEVLVFEKDGFRGMKDNEFQVLTDLIESFADSKKSVQFSDRAIRYFYNQYVRKNSN